MAKTIGQLTSATTIGNSDLFVIEQSSQTKKISASVVRGGLINADIDAAAAIVGTKLADDSITNVKIKSDAAIAGSKLADGGVTLAKLAAAVANALVPVGCVDAFARSTAPTGWLAANGSTIGSASSSATNASADYSALFTVLWGNWTNTDLPILDSAGAASTRGASASADFAANKRLPLPDLRGIFVRGSRSQTISGTAYSGTFAEKQQDAFKSHTHSSSTAVVRNIAPTSTGYNVGLTTGNLDPNNAVTTTATGGTETRPANIALLYCIKF
jgi:hypothetical protein